MDAGPYDNVEFPIKSGSQTWSGPQTSSSTKLYGYNVANRDRVTGGTPTLPPLAETENGENGEAEEHKQLFDFSSPLEIHSSSSMSQSSIHGNPSPGIQTPSPGFQVTPLEIYPPQQSDNITKKDTIVTANKEVYIANSTTPNAVPHKSATMPNLTQQKPMPSPSLSRVVLEQPRSIAKRFTEQDFNPRSQEVFNKTHEVKGRAGLNITILEEGNKMKENVWDVKGKPGEMMSYEQLLQGMLIEGEMLLLGGSWLQFSNIDFLDQNGKETVKPSVGKGRLCLTNQRLLILSADVDCDASLDTKDSEFRVGISKCITTYFQNIPLNGVYSVELSSSVGNRQESRILPQKPCCCGICSCLPISCCKYSWKADVPIYKTINDRIIRIGVVMPPWQTQTFIVVHLHPEIPLTTGRDFVSLLHNYAPRIH